jgi:hypothetical protein
MPMGFHYDTTRCQLMPDGRPAIGWEHKTDRHAASVK